MFTLHYSAGFGQEHWDVAATKGYNLIPIYTFLQKIRKVDNVFLLINICRKYVHFICLHQNYLGNNLYRI